MNDTDWILNNSARHDLFIFRTMHKYAHKSVVEKWGKYLSIKRLLRKVLEVGQRHQTA